MTISGLDNLNKQMKELKFAADALDGEYAVNFDAHDPVSIENAIQEAYSMVDQRAGKYSSNSLVVPLIEQTKESLREHILNSAEERRLKGDVEDDN